MNLVSVFKFCALPEGMSETRVGSKINSIRLNVYMVLEMVLESQLEFASAPHSEVSSSNKHHSLSHTHTRTHIYKTLNFYSLLLKFLQSLPQARNKCLSWKLKSHAGAGDMDLIKQLNQKTNFCAKAS